MGNKSLYAYLINQMFNKPLLISPSYMTALTRSMESQLRAGVTIQQIVKETALQPARDSISANGVAVIQVYDYLSYRADEMMSFFYGNTSYEQIRSEFQAALSDTSVKSIVFDINSPGGEVAGVFDLVDEIYAARGAKPIYAVFNEDGFSAAFAIASAADKRYVSRTGGAGSVGVVAMHLDQSGWDEKMGLVYTPIYAGARKVDFSSHAPLSPEAMTGAQADVNAVYDLFVGTVARNLGMAPADVRATEAGIYQGKKAVDLGFADSVMSMNQFMAKLTNRKYGGIMKAELEKLFDDMKNALLALVGADPAAAKQEVVTKADAEKLVAAAEASAKQEGHAAGISAGKVEGHQAGRSETLAYVAGIFEICALAGMETMAPDLIKKETALEAARTEVMTAKAAEAEKTQIRSTVRATTTGEANPLLADAKKRAAGAAGIHLVK